MIQVVFDALRKFDGKEFRQLLPGEYTQMAGRAGRRGLDKTGTVVVMCRDEVPDESDLRRIIVGSATRLESQFRLTYIMILHLLRVEELKVNQCLNPGFCRSPVACLQFPWISCPLAFSLAFSDSPVFKWLLL